MIRHCEEAVFIDFNSSCGPAAEDITVQSRCRRNGDGGFISFLASLGSLRCARGDGPGIAVGHLMGVALIVQCDDVASNANGQGISRHCGNPCIAGDILFVLRHRNLLFEGLSVVDHRIFQILVRTLFLVPHGQTQVRPLCPDCVQVRAFFGDIDGVSGDVARSAALGCGPAGENVAGGGGEAYICYGFHGFIGISSNTAIGIAFRNAVVNQCCLRQRHSVLCDKGHISSHHKGIAGFVNDASLPVLPV